MVSVLGTAPPRAERGSSFYLAFLALPRDQREALAAVYGACRLWDDLADDLPPGSGPGESRWEAAAEALREWRREIENVYEGRPVSHVGERLAAAVRGFGLPKDAFLDVLDGVEMDLTISRYATFADLEPYMHRVASAVGYLCLPVLGAPGPGARDYARALGCALQLTNILRDVGSDLDRGRIYLPQADRERFGVAEEDLLARRYTPGFIELMRFEWERARAYFEAAQVRRAEPLLPAEIMGSIYEALLEKLREARFAVLDARIELSPAEKLAAAWTALRRH